MGKLTNGYDNNMYEKFKKRLKEEIKLSGMTTKELAEKVGVTDPMITQYYTTDKLPSVPTFEKLCRALDVSADYLLGLTDE
ncbi:MAG: helix-turn-helix transcriptional regulator [Clostridiales bacterium]|nr:helix-turn-helix transcriptional regulator [Clostridiales bacterium]